ncbi:hypothetical protein QL285_062689 [Trifolium repens]|nr:hypothetical protein QL285_062689 [Trifolium repens]
MGIETAIRDKDKSWSLWSCDNRNRKRNQNQNRNRTLTQESELDSRPRLNWDWVSKREKDVELSDFSGFENHPTPFCYICPRFVYKNKAHKDEEEKREKALHEYKERSCNLTPFDAIPVPPKIQIMASNFPKPIGITNDEDHAFLTELSLIALAQYNADQGSNYDFDGLVKAVRRHYPRYTYYITFKAKDPSNCPAAVIFQARVCDRRSLSDKPQPPVVAKSCFIKT